LPGRSLTEDMKYLKISGFFVLLFVLTCAAICRGADSAPEAEALAHTMYLSGVIGPRVAGTPAEASAREYIYKAFAGMGYAPVEQAFSFVDGAGTRLASANVIAVKAGASEKRVIVGGHYDSVSVGRGAGDNAAAIGALLATARRLKDTAIPYTVVFVAFGAEEVGIYGSAYYAAHMSPDELSSAIAMINLDTIIGGDRMYVYGGLSDTGWVRDQALSIADSLSIPLETSPGLNPQYPRGTTGPWSDHVSFEDRGIAIAYFETTNWEIGDLDGYDQTEAYGPLWHTEKDRLAFLWLAFPGRVGTQLYGCMETLYALLVSIEPPGGTPAGNSRGVHTIFMSRFEPNRGR